MAKKNQPTTAKEQKFLNKELQAQNEHLKSAAKQVDTMAKK